MKASRERGIFKIMPRDGAKACKTISLDRRHLGLVMEEGPFVDHGNMKERIVSFENQKYVYEWYSNAKLEVGKTNKQILSPVIENKLCHQRLALEVKK